MNSMKKSSLYTLAGLLMVIGLGIYSCKKVNGIDNNTVVETPYSLYFSDQSGVLFNSNDGIHVQKLPFQADGYPTRALGIMYNNVFLAKNNLYISSNNGQNFNHSYDSLGNYPDVTCSGQAIDLNQSMIICIQDWNEFFVASNEPNGSDNWLGIRQNLYGGSAGDWWADIADSLGNIGDYNPAFGDTITITSFTLMPNGVLAGYDAKHNRNFYRTKTTLWNECTANPDSSTWYIGSPLNHTGNRLPHHVYRTTLTYQTIDLSSNYSYGHFNDQLIAIDRKDCNDTAAYYSNDTGRHWTPFTGLPKKACLCISSPFEQICLIGTNGAGLYMLNTNTNIWQPNNKGLGSNLVVNNIAFKQNVYKNGRVARFIYLATNQGIYQSTDMGNNWTLTIPGNYVTIY